MTKEKILRKLVPCRNPACGEPTPYPDGYCETCIPPEQEYDDHPYQPAKKEPVDGKNH